MKDEMKKTYSRLKTYSQLKQSNAIKLSQLASRLETLNSKLKEFVSKE